MDNNSKSDTSLQNVPQAWPGAFGAYKYSRDAIKYNWKTYLAIVLLAAAASFVVELFLPSNKTLGTATLSATEANIEVIVNLVGMLVGVFFAIGVILVALANIRRQQIDLRQALKSSFQYFINALALTIIQAVIALLSLLLFIVPFFFVMPRLALATYYLVDQDLGPVEAIKASWVGTKGSALKVWGIVGATILMALLAVTIIGIPFAIYFLFMYSVAYGVLYVHLNKKPVEAKS